MSKDSILKIYNDAIAKSINQKKEKLILNKKHISKQSLIIMLTLTSTISLVSCNPNINQLAVNNYNSIYISEAQQELEKYNIKYYDESTGMLINHSIEEYAQIKTLNENTLIGYYELLGYDECEKIVQALGYNNWNDYLLQKNFIDKNGNPDIKKWENETKIENFYNQSDTKRK